MTFGLPLDTRTIWLVKNDVKPVERGTLFSRSNKICPQDQLLETL